MLHGFEVKYLLSVGMLTRPVQFWNSTVSMFLKGLPELAHF